MRNIRDKGKSTLTNFTLDFSCFPSKIRGSQCFQSNFSATVKPFNSLSILASRKLWCQIFAHVFLCYLHYFLSAINMFKSYILRNKFLNWYLFYAKTSWKKINAELKGLKRQLKRKTPVMVGTVPGIIAYSFMKKGLLSIKFSCEICEVYRTLFLLFLKTAGWLLLICSNILNASLTLSAINQINHSWLSRGSRSIFSHRLSVCCEHVYW